MHAVCSIVFEEQRSFRRPCQAVRMQPGSHRGRKYRCSPSDHCFTSLKTSLSWDDCIAAARICSHKLKTKGYGAKMREGDAL